MSHTPGPWCYADEDRPPSRAYVIYAGAEPPLQDRTNHIAVVWGSEADARLIAAAPSLDLMLRRLLDEVANGDVKLATVKEALRVLDRATGEQVTT